MNEVIQMFFAWLGVNFQAVATAVALVLPVVAFLAERVTLPDLHLWSLTVKGKTLLALLVSLIVGGYGQYQLGLAWYSIVGGGVLTFLGAAGVYDLTVGALKGKMQVYEFSLPTVAGEFDFSGLEDELEDVEDLG